jgi:hypothetical protein
MQRDFSGFETPSVTPLPSPFTARIERAIGQRPAASKEQRDRVRQSLLNGGNDAVKGSVVLSQRFDRRS